MSKRVIKIGFDLHGVIDSIPEFFALFTALLVDAGHEVHVITGAKWDEGIEQFLNDNGIKWTHKFSITDFHIEAGTPMRYDPNPQNPWIDTGDKEQDNVLWDRTKADYCAKHHIDLHLDDTMRYNDYFTTPFARVWTKTNTPKPQYKDKRHLD